APGAPGTRAEWPDTAAGTPAHGVAQGPVPGHDPAPGAAAPPLAAAPAAPADSADNGPAPAAGTADGGPSPEAGVPGQPGWAGQTARSDAGPTVSAAPAAGTPAHGVPAAGPAEAVSAGGQVPDGTPGRPASPHGDAGSAATPAGGVPVGGHGVDGATVPPVAGAEPAPGETPADPAAAGTGAALQAAQPSAADPAAGAPRPGPVAPADAAGSAASPAPAAESGPVQRPAGFGGSGSADESGSWVIPSEVTDPAQPVAEAPAAPAPVPPPVTDSEHPEVSYVLRVNGIDRAVSSAWIGESLLYVLRERLGLAGAKDGCSQGECGACSVQVDGRLVAACLVPAATAAGSEIRTVEGLGTESEPSDVQRALASCAVQCGFCLPGMAMTVHDLLEGNHAPTELQTRQALCGNLCRCSGYRGVLDAVRTVIEERAERAERAEQQSPRIPQQAGPPEGDA
ncbi:2Fe-2S iron-sulfur cluster-binding protein, partial [Streptomyces sp. NPDC059853]|uniref:(2Fe-2S)-binding protein n=1 Tax=Streptomyces sp. NPDC059853 TaxID=3346973 RepID=UPI00365F6C3D